MPTLGGVVLVDPATGEPYKAATTEEVASQLADPNSELGAALSSTYAPLSVLTDAQSAATAAAASAASAEAAKDYFNQSIEATVIDNSAAMTSAISTTSRRFLAETVPAGVYLSTINFRTQATAATITIEVWEYNPATGNIMVAKTVNYTNAATAGVKTATLDYTTVGTCYISFRNSASAVGYNATGNGLYIADIASTSLALSALSTGASVRLAVTLTYLTAFDPLAYAMALSTGAGTVLGGYLATVGENGQFSTIQAACDAVPAGGKVLVYPGTYREQVSVYGKEVHIEGTDRRNCILIDSSSDYRTPPLEINFGSVRNLTIIEDALSPAAGLESVTFEGHPVKNMAYCIHADSGDGISDSDTYLTIEDCILINANRPCVGMGLYKNYHVQIRNVEMRSGLGVVAGYQRGALYFHNNATNGTLGQSLSVVGNRIYCDDQYTIYALDTGATGGTCSVELINNMAYSTVNGKAAGSVFNQLGAGATFNLAPTSYGNNVASLNA